MHFKQPKKQEVFWGYVFITPQIMGFLLFFLFPIIAAFYLSFTKWNLMTAPSWVFLTNYIRQFQDPKFYQIIKNTLYFTFAYIPLVVTASLGLALLINNDIPGKNIYRTIFFMPNVTSLVAISILWKWLLQPEFGLINYTLSFLHISGPEWLSSKVWAMPGIILMRVWWGAGYYMVILLAGLKSIPKEYYEAAEIDGSSRIQTFRYITFPHLLPSILLSTTMAAIWTFKEFEQIFMMTGGGPADSTKVLVLQIYNQAFRYMRMGDATALSMILFVIIGVFTVVNFKITKRKGT